MTMRCRFHSTCTITDCPHHAPHEHNKFCDKDDLKAVCRGGDDPYCLPENKREVIHYILAKHLSPEGAVEVTDQIIRALGIEEAA